MSNLNLSELAENIKTQDNLGTLEPLYCVYAKTTLPVDDESCGGHTVREIWIDAEDYNEVEDEEFSSALSVIAEGNSEVEVMVDGYKTRYERKFVAVIPVFITACLTRAGADAYIAANGHNLEQPYVYVHSLYRNDEMIGLRAFITEAGKVQS